MSLLNKLTFKNLMLNKKRTIVTIIGIILSVSLITAVASMYASLIDSSIYYEKMVEGDYHAAYLNVPEEEIGEIEANRNAEAVSVIKNIGYAETDSKNSDKPYAAIRALDKESMSRMVQNLTEGRLPEKEDEIVIPEHLKTNGRVKLAVGDKITLDVGKRVDNDGNEIGFKDSLHIDDNDNREEKLANTKSMTFTIVGITQRPGYTVEAYTLPGYSYFVLDNNYKADSTDVFVRFNSSDMDELYCDIGGVAGLSPDVVHKIIDGDFDSWEETEDLENMLSSVKYMIDANVYLIQLEYDPLGCGFDSFIPVLAIVIAIIIFTSIICIKNSFDISVTEKTKQYGMLKSVGATKKQIRKNVFFEATILGGIGIALGVLAGIFATYVLIMVSNYLLGEMMSEGMKLICSVSYMAILVAVVLGVVTVYLSALGSSRRAAKIAPIDLIRNSGNIKIKAKKVRSPKFVTKLFGVGGEISYKNMKRNKKKYRTTIIAIVVSVSIFIAFSEFMILAFGEVHKQVDREEYNVYASVFFDKESETDDSINSILERFKQTTGFDNVSECTISENLFAYFNSKYYSEKYCKSLGYEKDEDSNALLSVVGLDRKQFEKYVTSLGLSYEKVKDKAILNDYLYGYTEESDEKEYIKETVFKDGEDIEIFYDDENWDTVSAGKFNIAKVTNKKPFGFRMTEDVLVILNEEEFAKHFMPDSINAYYESGNADKLQDDLEKFYGNGEVNVTNIDATYQMINNVITLVSIFIYGFIIVISLIGITNIFNTITTTMELRRQEFATLKSVGMTKYEFNRLIRLESIFIGTKSLAFGIPIGIGLSVLMYLVSSVDSDYYEYELPLNAIIISVIVVLLLIFIIMKYSLMKINKQNTIETIRNENI